MFLVGVVIFFFLLYLGLIVLSWYLFWLGIVLPVRRPDIAGGVILKIFLIPTGLLLLLFLCRGFFRRRRRAPRSLSIELHLEEHPRLEDFIRRLCAELAAPLPESIFVDYEVNAAAGYGPWPEGRKLLREWL